MPGVHPSTAALSGWLDDELLDSESKEVRLHLEGCSECRNRVFQWIEVARAASRAAPLDRPGSADCLDDEALAAYCDSRLPAEPATREERHLLTCEHCLARMRDGIRVDLTLQRLAENQSPGVSAEVRTDLLPIPKEGMTRERKHLGGDLRRRLGGAVSRSWTSYGALAAAAILVLTLTWMVPRREEGAIRFRGLEVGARVEVLVDVASGRALPDERAAVMVSVSRGEQFPLLEVAGAWVRVQTRDGRRIWLKSTDVGDSRG